MICQSKEYTMIEIKDITLEKLNFNINELKSGDIVRLRMPDYKYDYEIVRQVFDQITKLLPDNITLLFVPEKMELEK